MMTEINPLEHENSVANENTETPLNDVEKEALKIEKMILDRETQRLNETVTVLIVKDRPAVGDQARDLRMDIVGFPLDMEAVESIYQTLKVRSKDVQSVQETK
jgi:hypothetical protein